MKRVFRVSYQSYIEGVNEPWETGNVELEIEDNSFEKMFNNLIDAFNSHVANEGFDAAEVGYIEELPSRE